MNGGMVVVISSPADQGGPLDWAIEMLVNQPTLLESLTVVNKGTAAYVQIFDCPRKARGIAISNTNNTTGVITVEDVNSYVSGDKVTFTGITGLTTHYINAASGTTIKAYSTRALALAGGTPDVLPTNNGETGTFLLASLSTLPICEEYPIGDAAAAPTNVISLINARFRRGLYVRGVTAVNGTTLIGSSDLKYTPRYRHNPTPLLVPYLD